MKKSNIFKSILITILILLSSALYSQNIDKNRLERIISLNDNTVIYCNIISESRDFYLLQLNDGSIIKKMKSDIARVSENPLFMQSNNSIFDSSAIGNQKYDIDGRLILGVTAFLPGGLNFVFGAEGDNIAVRGSVGFIPIEEFVIGSQLDVLFPIMRDNKYVVSIMPSIGYTGFSGSDNDYMFMTGGANMNINGFDISAGGGFALIDGKLTPYPMFSIGYVAYLD